MRDFENIVETIAQHLNSNRQSWLFGAGISRDANIPLMYPLTARVKILIEKIPKHKEIYESLSADLDEKTAHIEHHLSHLGDLIALAERSKDKQASIDSKKFTQDELKSLHSAIVEAIGKTVRYGYKNDTEFGTLESPIINIETHRNFVKAFLKTRANLTSRSDISFITTNYDTLLEDAMALEKLIVVDGFSGAAMGFWNPEKEFEQELLTPAQYFLYKLHGSIDWHRNNNIGMVRARYGTNYLSDLSEIMIYPQATKYVETQKDPFASLFTQFRSILNSSEPNVLITCGYSFGDEHINAEIESSLKLNTNRTTIVAFTNEVPNGDIKINKTLDGWLTNPSFGKRILVAGENGVYQNSLIPINSDPLKKLDWWKFSGLIEFLNTGEV